MGSRKHVRGETGPEDGSGGHLRVGVVRLESWLSGGGPSGRIDGCLVGSRPGDIKSKRKRLEESFHKQVNRKRSNTNRTGPSRVRRPRPRKEPPAWEPGPDRGRVSGESLHKQFATRLWVRRVVVPETHRGPQDELRARDLCRPSRSQRESTRVSVRTKKRQS